MDFKVIRWMIFIFIVITLTGLTRAWMVGRSKQIQNEILKEGLEQHIMNKQIKKGGQ